MKSSGVRVAAARRAMLPAFCGISGSTRTMRILSARARAHAVTAAERVTSPLARERRFARTVVNPARELVVRGPEKTRLDSAALAAIHRAVEDVVGAGRERRAVELRLDAVVRPHHESGRGAPAYLLHDERRVRYRHGLA